MIKENQPDRIIVTTIDCFHAKYICRAMELGYNVFSGKPLANDEKMVQDIIETKMQDMIFRGPLPDPLGQAAGSREGALSALVGIAARRSIEQQRPILVENLVKT